MLGQYLLKAIHQTYQDNVETNLLAEARLVADDITPLLSDPSNNQKINSRVHYFARFLNVRVTIIRADGVVIGESDADPATMENHMNRPEFQQALHNQDGFQIRYSSTLKANMLYVATPIEVGDQIVAVTRLAKPLNAIEANLDHIRIVVISATIMGFILALLLAILVSEYTIRPLTHLTEASQQLADGKYRGAPLPISRDEIGRLNQAFNQMAAQIQAQIKTLQNQQGKLSSVLEQMTDGVIIVDADGKVQLINPAAERMFNIKINSALCQSLIRVVQNNQIVDLWRKCLDSGEQQTITLELMIEHLFVQVIATSLSQTLPGSTLLLLQDLTRQHRLETVRQDFISNVSHEFRTPLASLKALTETLQESALEDPPAAHRFLSRIETEVDNLTQLVQELLELSRIESGKVPLNRKALAPISLLSPSIDRMVLQAERAGLIMKLECPPDLPYVLADPERLEQVLVNLLHNAIKFTPPGGEIVVSARSEGEEVIFQVRDTGLGISFDDLPRIFERFYKIDRARSGGGTGLGLSIAKHLIEAHRGRIWVESTRGKGSTFYFSLPISKILNSR